MTAAAAAAADPVNPDEPVKAELTEENSPKVRKTVSAHFGDDVDDFQEEEIGDIGDATWAEVRRACCVHTPEEWGKVFLGACGALFFLYFFLFSLELLGNSAKVLGGCTAGGIMGDSINPVAALVIGELATALVQSSSTTTSIVVSLVGSDSMNINTGIYMVMGANIGTSVTNTIVSMGQMADGIQLERAFAGATVHDLFNFLTVAVLFPLELITGYLRRFTSVMLPDSVDKGEKWTGPIKKIVSPVAGRVLKANKNVLKDISIGKVENCEAYYPVFCVGGIEDYKSCAGKCGDGQEKGVDCGRVGLITCDKNYGCPAFFQNGATKQDDSISGGVCLVLSLVCLLLCLMGFVNVLQRGLMGMSTRVIYKATNVPGIVAIAIGAAVTVLIQSSSITTSVLTPLVGLGVVQLEQMLPLTLGANVGTTVTGLLASMVSDSVSALQVALCHLFFNVSGIIIWYPVPFMRKVPLNAARELGKWTRRSKLIPPIYIFLVFFTCPLLLLGINELFAQKKIGWTVLGSVVVIAVGLGIIRFAYWWKKQDGRTHFIAFLDKRTFRSNALAALPEDMQYLKSKVAQLAEHTGLPEDEDEEVDEEKAQASEGTDEADETEHTDTA